MTEMLLAEDNDVIKAIPPDRTDEPLRAAVLPWRPRRQRYKFHARGAHDLHLALLAKRLTPPLELSIRRVLLGRRLLSFKLLLQFAHRFAGCAAEPRRDPLERLLLRFAAPLALGQLPLEDCDNPGGSF
jgi:hypothetical protein